MEELQYAIITKCLQLRIIVGLENCGVCQQYKSTEIEPTGSRLSNELDMERGPTEFLKQFEGKHLET